MQRSANTNIETGPSAPMALLRDLARDQQLRAAIEADPAAALAEYGVYVESEQVPARVTLPTPQALQHFLSETDEDSSRPQELNKWAGFFGGLLMN